MGAAVGGAGSGTGRGDHRLVAGVQIDSRQHDVLGFVGGEEDMSGESHASSAGRSTSSTRASQRSGRGETGRVIVGFIGDAHGQWGFVRSALLRLRELAEEHGSSGVAIQVGDLGWWPAKGFWLHQVLKAIEETQTPLWALDGNHEFPGDSDDDQSGYRAWTDPAPDPEHPTLVHLPRSTVVELAGLTIGAFGGGVSVDRRLRIEGET